MNTDYRDQIAREAVSAAEAWQNRADELLTPEEKAIQSQMKRLLTHPADKAVMTKMIDQSFRSANHRRIADQINYIFKEHGVPEFFSTGDKLLMRLFLGIGRHFPRSQAPAWERICARSPGFGSSPVTGSRGFPGKCVPKPGLGNEKKQ